MDNESKPPKPYTRYKSSRLRGKFGKPLGSADKPRSVDEKTSGAGASGAGGRGSGYGGYPGGAGRDGGLPPDARAYGKPRRRWGKRIGIALLILVLLLLAATGIVYWRIDRAVKASNAKVPSDVHQVLKPATSGPYNILFMGSDQRPGDSARADTLLIMRVNPDTKTISQLSIPRDTLADIPGYGEGKINSAYAYGGPALQIRAIQELTGIPINHYVELDFSGFPAIVDALGGVDINVPKTIDSQYPQGYDWTQVHFNQGMQHMDGATALVYVRVRYSDDDFQRMGRQQQFMEALQKKMASPFNLAKMPLMAPDIIGGMVTDMSTSNLMGLAWTKFRSTDDPSRKFVLVGAPSDIGGVSYVVLDGNANQGLLSQFLAG